MGAKRENNAKITTNYFQLVLQNTPCKPSWRRRQNPSSMRETYARLSPERKNTLLVLYLLGFAILTVGTYAYPILAVILLFAYPAGAMLFGYVTRDSIRAVLAGTLSYVFIILIILLSLGMAGFHQTIISPFRFAGYHLTLLFVLGVIGWMASKKERLPRILALPLAVLWVLLFFSGIS